MLYTEHYTFFASIPSVQIFLSSCLALPCLLKQSRFPLSFYTSTNPLYIEILILCPPKKKKTNIPSLSYCSSIFPLREKCEIPESKDVCGSRVVPAEQNEAQSRRISPLGSPNLFAPSLHPHLLPNPRLEMRRHNRDVLASGSHGAADLVSIRVHCTLRQCPHALIITLEP